MANIIFGFNGNEITIPMEDTDAKKLFHDVTGVSIIDESYQNDLDIITEEIIQHPTLEQLVELFRDNLNNEISTKLIKDKFYPNYTGSWRRIIVNIYEKIQKALDKVEIIESGKYLKRRQGKYIIYLFVRNDKFDKTLDDFMS